MSRWFRHYAGMMRDEKLVRAAMAAKQPVERVSWVWGAILESAAEINDGGRFQLDPAETAYFLRTDEADIRAILDALTALQRLAGDTVVKWGDRQFQSDRSAARQAAHRERQEKHRDNNQQASRDGGVTADDCHGDGAVTHHRQIQNTERKKDSELRSGASAPVYTDSVHELWGEGVPILASLGCKDREARSNIGRWLKDVKNDAQQVLGAIQRARDARVIEPIAWITRAISGGSNETNRRNRGGVSAITAAIDGHIERFQREASDGGEVRQAPPRLLPSR